jgi:hypothetical protein
LSDHSDPSPEKRDDDATDKAAPPKRGGVKFNPEVGLGQIINAVVMAGGIVYAIANYTNKVDNTQRDVQQLRTEMTRQLAEISVSVNEQFKGVRTDIANLPDVKAELTQLERRADQSDNRAGAQSNRLDRLQETIIQTSSDVAGLLRDKARKNP